jgi:hypothetical protein
MFSQLGRLEICCDAPPYDVVRACEKYGFYRPLDVRWCRMNYFASKEGRHKKNLGIRLWQRLFGTRETQVQTCACGQPLPELQKYGFTFHSKKVRDYLLGQCHRCRTMYWDDPLPLRAWMQEDGDGLTDSLEM